MNSAHVFVETNFLFGVFRMPSKRHRNALALKARFDAGEVNPTRPRVWLATPRFRVPHDGVWKMGHDDLVAKTIHLSCFFLPTGATSPRTRVDAYAPPATIRARFFGNPILKVQH